MTNAYKERRAKRHALQPKIAAIFEKTNAGQHATPAQVRAFAKQFSARLVARDRRLAVSRQG